MLLSAGRLWLSAGSASLPVTRALMPVHTIAEDHLPSTVGLRQCEIKRIYKCSQYIEVPTTERCEGAAQDKWYINVIRH